MSAAEAEARPAFGDSGRVPRAVRTPRVGSGEHFAKTAKPGDEDGDLGMARKGKDLLRANAEKAQVRAERGR